MTQTLSQEITAKLTRRIVDNRYPSGTKLPTERDLAEEFGVTRHVIREALKRLEAVGLVRIRQGSGILVEDLPLTGGIELFEILLLREDGSINLPVLRNVLEFRANMVRSVVRLAAERRSDEEMRELESLLAQRAACAGDAEQLEQLTHRMFQVIAQATRNRVYELAFNTMGKVFFRLRALVDIPLMGHEQADLLLQRIMEAFEHRDSAMADLLVSRYLESLQQLLDSQNAE
jgi:GntR family transcriptional regulator, transcriptional repressor for pyruvate dehydrogenase complex